MNPKPTVSRIVHYVIPTGRANTGQHRPAIIVSVSGNSELVTLSFFTENPGDYTDYKMGPDDRSVIRVPAVRYDEKCPPGTWHWPEREDTPGPKA